MNKEELKLVRDRLISVGDTETAAKINDAILEITRLEDELRKTLTEIAYRDQKDGR